MKLMPQKRKTGMTEASVLSQWDRYLEVCKRDNDRFLLRNGGKNSMARLSELNNKRGGRPKKVLEIANG